MAKSYDQLKEFIKTNLNDMSIASKEKNDKKITGLKRFIYFEILSYLDISIKEIEIAYDSNVIESLQSMLKENIKDYNLVKQKIISDSMIFLMIRNTKTDDFKKTLKTNQIKLLLISYKIGKIKELDSMIKNYLQSKENLENLEKEINDTVEEFKKINEKNYESKIISEMLNQDLKNLDLKQIIGHKASQKMINIVFKIFGAKSTDAKSKPKPWFKEKLDSYSKIYTKFHENQQLLQDKDHSQEIQKITDFIEKQKNELIKDAFIPLHESMNLDIIGLIDKNYNPLSIKLYDETSIHEAIKDKLISNIELYNELKIINNVMEVAGFNYNNLLEFTNSICEIFPNVKKQIESTKIKINKILECSAKIQEFIKLHESCQTDIEFYSKLNATYFNDSFLQAVAVNILKLIKNSKKPVSSNTIVEKNEIIAEINKTLDSYLNGKEASSLITNLQEESNLPMSNDDAVSMTTGIDKNSVHSEVTNQVEPKINLPSKNSDDLFLFNDEKSKLLNIVKCLLDGVPSLDIPQFLQFHGLSPVNTMNLPKSSDVPSVFNFNKKPLDIVNMKKPLDIVNMKKSIGTKKSIDIMEKHDLKPLQMSILTDKIREGLSKLQSERLKEETSASVSVSPDLSLAFNSQYKSQYNFSSVSNFQEKMSEFKHNEQNELNFQKRMLEYKQNELNFQKRMLEYKQNSLNFNKEILKMQKQMSEIENKSLEFQYSNLSSVLNFQEKILEIDKQMSEIDKQMPEIDKQMSEIDKRMPEIDKQMSEIENKSLEFQYSNLPTAFNSQEKPKVDLFQKDLDKQQVYVYTDFKTYIELEEYEHIKEYAYLEQQEFSGENSESL